jgi:hypothetical protein
MNGSVSFPQGTAVLQVRIMSQLIPFHAFTFNISMIRSYVVSKTIIIIIV